MVGALRIIRAFIAGTEEPTDTGRRWPTVRLGHQGEGSGAGDVQYPRVGLRGYCTSSAFYQKAITSLGTVTGRGLSCSTGGPVRSGQRVMGRSMGQNRWMGSFPPGFSDTGRPKNRVAWPGNEAVSPPAGGAV